MGGLPPVRGRGQAPLPDLFDLLVFCESYEDVAPLERIQLDPLLQRSNMFIESQEQINRAP